MTFEKSHTGDRFHASESHHNNITYGVIAIEPRQTNCNLAEAEQILVHFLTGLQNKFDIQHSTGVSKDVFSRDSRPVLVDYWQDSNKTDWKVKGWTNGKTYAVLYIKNINEASVAVEDRFLDGTLFTGS